MVFLRNYGYHGKRLQ